MTDVHLDRLRDAIQEDVGCRGLCTDPVRNLVNAYPDDFRLACAGLAEHPRPCVAIVTGFLIPSARPVAGETDGPLGALFLARALIPLGFHVVLVTDDFCIRALRAGLLACGLQRHVPVIMLPTPAQAAQMSRERYTGVLFDLPFARPITHLVSIERPGPCHTLESVQRQLEAAGAVGESYLDFLDVCPQDRQDCCHTMRGVNITDRMSPAHLLFEAAPSRGIATLGIGDGGNEIGMGKIAWDVIHRNVPGGGLIACRIPTDHVIVGGVSNWGAYALAAGVARLRRGPINPRLFDPAIERRFLETMVQHGPLVDGVLGRPSATVDGLSWEQYAVVLSRIGEIVGGA